METPSEDLPHYVQVMWSVPYDYNTYNAYLAVGIANEFLNSSNLFNELYYHIGPFERVKAGNLAEYTAPELKGIISIGINGIIELVEYMALTVSNAAIGSMISFVAMMSLA